MHAIVTEKVANQVPNARKPHTERFYQDVRTAYKALSDKKKYSVEYMIDQVAEKFYRSPKTIENIVFERV